MKAGYSLFRSLVLFSAVLPGSAGVLIGQDGARDGAGPPSWVGTWASSPVGVRNASDGTGVGGPEGTTLHEVVHVSVGGSTVRVVFTNEFGSDPLTIGGAQIARPGGGVSIVPQGAAALTFSGRPTVTIPPGAMIVSDPVRFDLAPLSDACITLFLPAQPIRQITRHSGSGQSNFFVGGNAVGQVTMTAPKVTFSWDFLKGIDVEAGKHPAAVVAFGDSITDGARSSVNANARWPDELSRRLAGDRKSAGVGVLNEGIGGNRILHDVTGPSALSRFDRDVLAQAGARYVVLLEGINDIGHATDPGRPFDVVSAADLIAGLTQMAERAHTHGLKVYGATLTPYGGCGYSSPSGEAERQALNQWIRTTSSFDAVIDFEKVVRDPANPTMFLPAYDSGDHLHPSDAGYKAMGDSIDLKLFER